MYTVEAKLNGHNLVACAKYLGLFIFKVNVTCSVITNALCEHITRASVLVHTVYLSQRPVYYISRSLAI